MTALDMNPGLQRVNEARQARRDARMEDLEWMADTGEIVERAAYRLGMTRRSLERYLWRNGRGDLWERLGANDPMWGVWK